MYAKYVQPQNNGGTVDKLPNNVILRKILQQSYALLHVFWLPANHFMASPVASHYRHPYIFMAAMVLPESTLLLIQIISNWLFATIGLTRGSA